MVNKVYKTEFHTEHKLYSHWLVNMVNNNDSLHTVGNRCEAVKCNVADNICCRRRVCDGQG
jgi:hypothetical protein